MSELYTTRRKHRETLHVQGLYVEPNTAKENSGNVQQKVFCYAHLLVYSTNVYVAPVHVKHAVKALGNIVGKNMWHPASWNFQSTGRDGQIISQINIEFYHMFMV